MIWLLLILVILLIALIVVDFQISAPTYKGSKSDHFDGKAFRNPDDPPKSRSRSIWDLIKWALTGNRGEWTRVHEQEAHFDVPKRQPANPDETIVTFVNHSTFLIQTNGINILTDPIWSERASPYSWIGPKRMHPPGIRFEDLPPIDLVLISHNHYDHLDLSTALQLKTEHDPFFITPLGVGNFLNQHHINQTIDLDWWEKHIINQKMTVNGVPARHFSGRGVFDRDRTLWCGYVMETPHQTLYFAGDTAYGRFFTDIGNHFSIDLSIIPIGAYKPRWFMQPIHANPDDAVQIHQDVQSSHSIASHFGTFPLADEAMDEPSKDLSKVLQKTDLTSADFRALQEGESYSYRPLRANMP
jgi:L-ascorbate metabolism protein UlaG (beta-lactamase superfamily)